VKWRTSTISRLHLNDNVKRIDHTYPSSYAKGMALIVCEVRAHR